MRLAFCLIACMLASQPAVAQSAPETDSGRTAKQAAHAKSFMIAAANPHAARAGYRMLERGGSAVDAAIAAMLVLGLVEPQAAGIGGGGYLLHWSAKARSVEAYDGQSTAPAAARPDRFLDGDGTPVPRREAGYGGRMVAVPGLVRMLADVHARHGRLPWADLFAPAIRLARDGFALSPRLHKELQVRKRRLRHPATRAYFLDAAGAPLVVGHRLVNTAYAETLRRIARSGPDALYRGEIARDIAAGVSHAPEHPAAFTERDLAGYRVHRRQPLCTRYRGHRVCTMPPSSAGGLTVAMILGMLERFDLAALDVRSPAWAHLFIEAGRLAYADRSRYIGDPDFVTVPQQGLLNRGYLAGRAARIDPQAAQTRVRAGRPPMKRAMRPATDDTPEPPSTTHLSVVDAAGNAVALTATIGRAFGSGIMVRGFMLNNQMIAFAFRPKLRGAPVANRIAPGKRPRSSMAPTFVFRADGGLRLVVGSPGGTRIADYVAQTLLAAIDGGLDIQAAIDLPHALGRPKGAELERDTPAASLADPLRERGHHIKTLPLTSGLHGIEITVNGLVGGADPRREGIALGD